MTPDVLALKLLLAPGLVVVASACARRFGSFLGGAVGGLPVVAGPILLVLAVTHGRRFGSEAAQASALGLVSLTAFVLVYGFLCRRRPWPFVLPVGWAAFLAVTALFSGVEVGTALALACAIGMFVAALRVLPAADATGPAKPPPRWDLQMRAVSAAAMVVALTAASSSLGPYLSGLLAPFPVITSVLAAFTHAQRGPAETLSILRGMVVGFFAFALFTATAAAALHVFGVAAAFAIATVVAVTVQAAVLGARALLNAQRARPLPALD